MSRASILGKVRTALHAPADDAFRKGIVSERIAAPPIVAAPQRVTAPNTDLAARFKEELELQLAAVVEVTDPSQTPMVIADYLRTNNQPLRLRHGMDPRLSKLDFTAVADFEVQTGPASPDDSAGLSYAFAGVAETGTMALLSGPENPVTLGFLPDTHIIVVPTNQIVPTYEDAFALLRLERGVASMPRTLNLISGPSRTADIGGRIVIGAHGPRRLLAVITPEL